MSPYQQAIKRNMSSQFLLPKRFQPMEKRIYLEKQKLVNIDQDNATVIVSADVRQAFISLRIRKSKTD